MRQTAVIEMSKQPRARSVARFIGLAFTAMTFIVWCMSTQLSTGTPVGDNAAVGIDRGMFRVEFIQDYRRFLDTPWLWVRYQSDFGFRLPGIRTWSPINLSNPIFEISVPCWLIFALSAIPTAILFGLEFKRVRPGFCPTCNYNLTGNESGICPECGTMNGEVKVSANGDR